jgi:Zn-finger nucleic acid-binding protein
MNCPICDIAMRISDRDGVEIDYCPQCRGVWLDRGELEKIIARVESQQSGGREERDEDEDRQGGRRAGQYRDDDSRREGEDRREGESKYGGKRKEKEGFFSNLFDMFGD